MHESVNEFLKPRNVKVVSSNEWQAKVVIEPLNVVMAIRSVMQ